MTSGEKLMSRVDTLSWSKHGHYELLLLCSLEKITPNRWVHFHVLWTFPLIRLWICVCSNFSNHTSYKKYFFKVLQWKKKFSWIAFTYLCTSCSHILRQPPSAPWSSSGCVFSPGPLADWHCFCTAHWIAKMVWVEKLFPVLKKIDNMTVD